jgi:glycosyltransferase involved in cell wall biosynthesis
MKKIIIILPSFESGSPIRSALSLIKGILEEYDVLVVSINRDIIKKDSIKNSLIELKVDFVFLNNNGLKNIFKARRNIQILLNNQKPDIVISYLLRADLILAMTTTKAKKVSSIRNMLEHEYIISHGLFIGKVSGYFHKLALNKFDKLIIMSNDMRDYFLSNKFNTNKLELIYNSLDEQDIKIKTKEIINFPFLNRLPTVVAISSLIKRKNVSLLLEAAIELLDQGLRFNILIIGDGSEKDKLTNIINNSKHKDSFHFMGHIYNPIPFLMKSEIFVMTSISEGVSRSLMEALYLGKLCIVSNIDGNRELIQNNKNGYLFNNKQELVDIIQKQLVNIFSNKKNLLPNKFRSNVSLDLHKKLFEEIIEKTDTLAEKV